MATERSRWRRRAKLALVGLLALPLVALFAMNVFINIGVPFLVNGKPDKVRLQYTFAWSWWPGEVQVWGLAIRGQGKNDQWYVTVDHAEGTIDLQALRDREFRAIDLRGKGGSFRYRFRADAPVDPALDHTPPVPGLTNPPDPPPDPRRAPKGPFEITLVGLQVEDLREVWIQDYRFQGSAKAIGDLKLADVMSATGKMTIPDGQVSLGTAKPLANKLTGEVAVDLTGIVRGQPITIDTLRALDARVDLSAMSEDLSFLDFFLGSAPWLRLDGKAALAMDGTMVDGEWQLASMMNMATQDLVVGFVAYEIRGDGTARLEVVDSPELGHSSKLGVKFGAFTIRHGAQEPLVEGTGVEITATSPRNALYEPLSGLHVVVDVPESTLPDARRFAHYLPTGVGIAIHGGTGTVESHLEAWSDGGRLIGTVDLAGDEVGLTMDGLVVTTDLSLHANLGNGEIGTGRYDFTGTEFEVHDLSVVDSDPDKKRDEEATRSWWAKVAVKEGLAHVGAPTYLDATVTMQCADSVPFVRIAAKHKSLPSWVQGVLDVEDVRGSARMRFGEESLAINPFYVSGDQLEVQLRWFREKTFNTGALFARYGKLSMAVDIAPQSTDVHVFDAMDWFAGEHAAEQQAEKVKEAARQDKKEARAETKAAKKEEQETKEL